jgi:hypothetical protein
VKDKYFASDKSEKGEILKSLEECTHRDRKHLIKVLNETKSGWSNVAQSKIGRPLSYNKEELFPHVRRLWLNMERISPWRMKAGLKDWLPFDEECPNTLDSKITKSGYTQTDTCAHCGDAILGAYAHSLRVTDIFSAWTVNRALFTKHGTRVAFTRSRPYKKNDNCFVEQKTFTHVRELFDYERFEDPKLVELMNDIYINYWNPLQNFFIPNYKLKEKIRVGSKVIKKYDVPQTPYSRLLNFGNLTAREVEDLREQKAKLNPFTLKRGLEEKLKEFFEHVRKTKIGIADGDEENQKRAA